MFSTAVSYDLKGFSQHFLEALTKPLKAGVVFNLVQTTEIEEDLVFDNTVFLVRLDQLDVMVVPGFGYLDEYA